MISIFFNVVLTLFTGCDTKSTLLKCRLNVGEVPGFNWVFFYVDCCFCQKRGIENKYRVWGVL